MYIGSHCINLCFKSISRPDVVEWHDVTAKDPKLLVYLKVIKISSTFICRIHF